MNAVIDFFDRLGMTGEAAIPLIWICVLFWWFSHIVERQDNPIEIWHFFSTTDPVTHEQHGDINSLGLIAGIVASLFTILWITYKNNDINPWILAVCLTYLGGVKAFAAWLRALAARRYGGEKQPKGEK